MTVKYAEVKYLQVPDGQIHEVVIVGTRRMDDGRCNLDDAAGELIEVDEAEALGGDPAKLCGHCFPFAGNPDAPV